MTQLLVSVRSVAEALAALEGGADVIDIKEPSRGALGKSDDGTLVEIVQAIGNQRPVSAAMGEIVDALPSTRYSPPNLAFIKYGLARCRDLNWRAILDSQRTDRPELVTVAYADWQLADAPPLSDVVNYAIDRGGVLLVDTWCKTSRSLLGWMAIADVQELCDRCREAGVRVALAGSLTIEAIDALRPTVPDWFAVRTAACDDGRNGRVNAMKVRALVDLLHPRLAVAR